MTDLREIPAFVADLDEHGTIADANRAAGRLSGCRPGSLPGKPLVAYVALADRPEDRRGWSRLIAGGGELIATVHLDCGGRTTPYRLVLSTVPEAFQPRRVRAVAVPLE